MSSTMIYTIPQYDTEKLHEQVMKAISIHYFQYSKTEKFFYKFGRACSIFKKNIRTPQASALTLISFWAAFVVTYFLITASVSTVTAWVIFGLIILTYTHATFDAVDALIKKAILNIL